MGKQKKYVMSSLSLIAVSLIPLLILFAGLFAKYYVIGRAVVDDHGVELTDELGQPIYEVDRWATWLNNWVSNLLMLVAGVLLIYALAS